MIKRAFDLIVAVGGLVVLAPIILALAVVVRLKLGAPVLFAQERAGKHGRRFIMRKFRSMTDARDATGALLPDHQRLVPVGLFLRATSMDELPTLWCVVTGHMSLVGPRPLLMDYLPLYAPEQARRHEVRPGITGWAQVNGRNAVGWPERFALDVWYVDHQSFWLDLKILWRTIYKVVRREGIAPDGHATMARFTGMER